MLKNRILSISLFILCAVLFGTKIIFAQAVTDNSKDQQINAALNAEEQVATTPQSANETQPAPAANTETSQPEQQAASAPVSMNAEQEAQPAVPPIPEAPAVKIVKAIDIEGNKSIGIAQILARIKTRVGEEYQEAVVSDDLKRLYNTGHFSDVQIDHEDLDDGYRVIVKLKEKPIVDEITFSKII